VLSQSIGAAQSVRTTYHILIAEYVVALML